VSLSFLSPYAAVAGLVGGLALVALRAARRRSARVESALGLAPPQRSSLLLDAGLIAAVAVLLALAAAQPVVSATAATKGREGAEVIVVVDITRSMSARRAPTEPTRLERAQRIAKELRAGVPDVRVGVASLTDRILPHLFPTLSANAFVATIDRAIGIQRPPPDRRSQRATSLGAIEDLGSANFFEAESDRRLAVVLTDGESLPIEYGRLSARLEEGRVAAMFVHVWHEDERIFEPGGFPPGPTYRPDETAPRDLRRLAGALDGAVYAEAELPELVGAVQAQLSTGPFVGQARELQTQELAPFFVVACAFPLVLLLWRRNA
jgi:von Willebrand factor type A domain